jgi:hypothetical protein
MRRKHIGIAVTDDHCVFAEGSRARLSDGLTSRSSGLTLKARVGGTSMPRLAALTLVVIVCAVITFPPAVAYADSSQPSPVPVPAVPAPVVAAVPVPAVPAPVVAAVPVPAVPAPVVAAVPVPAVPAPVVTPAPVLTSSVNSQSSAGATNGPQSAIVPSSASGTSTTKPPNAPTASGPVGLTLVAAVHMTDANHNGRKDAGDMIGIDYVLRNSGTVTVERLTITDPAVNVVCRSTSLAAGAATACTGSRTVTLADMNRGVIVSSAAAWGAALDGRAVKFQAASASVSLSVVSRLTIQQHIGALVDVDRDGVIGLGDRIGYGFTVSNTGNVTLSRVTILDVLLGQSSLGARCAATVLEPGTSTSCDAGYTVSAADVRRGKVQNFAAATATVPSGVAVRSNSSVTVQSVAGRVAVGPRVPKPPKPPRVPRPRIGLLQWILRIDDNNHDGLVDWGDGVVYGFRVTNSGGTLVTKIAIDDGRLAGQGVVISCPSGSLPPGALVTCTSSIYTATVFSMTHGAGPNYASATALSDSGTAIRSNSTLITLAVGEPVSAAVAAVSAPSTSLAFTGSPLDDLLRWAGGLIAAGLVLSLVSRKAGRLV